MKLRLITLAVLAATSGAAQAQSSVTLYGTLDVSGRVVKADGQSRRLSEATGGLNSSVLGFRGSEDLGDGLRAGFELQGDLFPDTGSAGAAGIPSKFFNRMAYLKLSSKFGELRLGRDYVPTFWNQGGFDAFGFVGLGASVTARQLYNGSRMDNTIGYFAPPGLGGFYGQAMVTAAEGGTTLDRPGRYVGLRAGYAAGPFNAAFSASATRFTTPFGAGANGVGAVVTAAPGDTQHTFNIGGSWDFGPAKLLGYYARDELKGYREDMFSVSSVIRFGAGEIHVGYDRSKLKNPALASTLLDQLKASYVYNLSKRTAMYATVSQLSNKDGTRLTLSGAAGSTTAGGKSQGAEFGLRHFF